MTFEPHRHTGANRQSHRSTATRPLLKKLMDKSPNPHLKEERERIFEVFREKVMPRCEPKCQMRNTEHFEVLLEYWFTNNYNSLLAFFAQPGAPSRQQRAVAKHAAKKKRTEQIKTAAVEAVAQIVLLDLMLPNGKALRECTGLECRQLGRKVGSWLVRIADQIKPDQIVGNVLKEEEVRKLYGGQTR